MNEHQPILDSLHRQAAEEASKKIAAYICRELLHESAGVYENGEDKTEGKN